jgi:phosphatidylserine/phosphatidylglycerophosphate/cardiolipin synthase-like enzyme
MRSAEVCFETNARGVEFHSMAFWRRACIALSVLTLAGCPETQEFIVDSGRLDANRPDTGRPDVTEPPADAAPLDAATSPMDSGGASDAGAPRDAATAVDSARPDSGPSCPCPPTPVACTPPAIEEPTFTLRDDSLQRQLNNVVACATSTLDMALYEVDSSCFVNVVLARLEAVPALTVRIVTNDESCPVVMGVRQCELSRLATHPRVQIIDDARTTLMHHKFIVADGRTLWLGSANITRRSFCIDENNAIVLQDPAVVASYHGEFRRMFEQRMFGPIAPEAAPAPGARFAVYFSPRTPTTQPPRWHSELINAIGAATRTLDFSVSAFTRTDISDALIAAHRRGVRVRGIVGASYAMDPAVMAMRAAGVDVRADEMHSKVLIIDGGTVTTGSANWSTNAWTNNENSLWIRDMNIATVYRTEFDRSFPMARMIP